MATHMSEAASALAKIADTAKPLYASLDESQKRVFGWLGRELLMMGHDHPGMGMMGHEGMGVMRHGMGTMQALDEHPEGNQCKIRSSKYLNNLIEQDHRSVKLRLGPMLGLKHFRQAATTIAGIELMHRIRKGQFKLGRLGAKGNTAPKIWNAVLAA
jgi:DDE domain